MTEQEKDIKFWKDAATSNAKHADELKAKLEAAEKERDEALACCAETRNALIDAQSALRSSDDGDQSGAVILIDAILDRSDCGKGFIRKSEVLPLWESLKTIGYFKAYDSESQNFYTASQSLAYQNALTCARKLGIE